MTNFDSTEATDVMNAFGSVKDDRSKITIRTHAVALLAGNWTKAELIPLARAFATLGVDADQFAPWATRQRRRVWWLD